jgi:hypothetical protein
VYVSSTCVVFSLKNDIRVFFFIFLSIIDLRHVSLLFRGFSPVSRSKWSHVPKHILSSVARTLGSWLRIYTRARVFFLCLFCSLYVGTSLEAGLAPKISVKYICKFNVFLKLIRRCSRTDGLCVQHEGEE